VLGSRTVRGSTEPDAASFRNSRVAAGVINNIRLRLVQVDNGNTPIGFAATEIGSASFTDSGKIGPLTEVEHSLQIAPDFHLRVV
jgi:hypothetical protein